MAREHNATLISLVVGMFISLLVCMSILGYAALSRDNSEYRYEILREDYTRKLQNVKRESEIKTNRLQEQINELQFTTSKRIALLDEQVRMYRSEARNPTPR